MINNIYKYAVLACFVLFQSCGKSFLEVDPIGQLGKEQLFNDVNGMRDALVGSYSLTAKFFQSQYGIYGDLRGDDVAMATASSNTYMLDDYNYSYNDEDQLGATQAIWASGYEAVNNLNNVIESASNLRTAYPASVDDITLYEGQAYVLRGLMFFALCNVYSQHYTYTADASHLGIPLPLKTPLPSEKLPRATVKETYSQIIADLEKGITALDGTQLQRIYASIDGAKALLSRIYLYMEDYDNAIKYASEVIETGNYSLVDSDKYSDMFLSTSQNSDFNSIASEIIWQFSLTTGTEQTYMSIFYGDRSTFAGYPKASYYALFADGDIRKEMFEYQAASSRYMSLKNSKTAATSDLNWPVNFKVVRSAELYLNRAEAHYHKQQYELAAEDLKVIQARALQITVEDVTLDYSSPKELLELIKMERRKELGFEGQRIYDVVRYKESLNRGVDCNSSVCSITYPSDIFVMPIPRAEIDANENIQPNPTVNN